MAKNAASDKDTLAEYLKQNNETLATRIDEMVKVGESSRTTWLPDWYDLEQKWLGNFYLVYVKSSNSFILGKTEAGRTQRTVNKLRSQLRGTKNLITRNDPRWDVEPDSNGEEAKQEALIANAALSHTYTRSGFKQVVNDVLWYGMMRSVGWFEADYDEEKELPIIRAWDAFDIITNPGATDERDARYIIKVVPKTIADILENEIYKAYLAENYKEDVRIQPDQKLAYSPVKEKLLSYQRSQASAPVSGLDTVLLYECWVKEVQADDSVKIRIITKAGGYILRDEVTDLDDFPFVAYKPEQKPGALYTTPWMKSVVDSNKAILRLLNQAEDYATKLQAGWIIKQSGTKVSKIFNLTGAVIEYEGGNPPQVAPVPPMPQSFMELVDYHERQIEDVGGTHSESMGRIAGTANSGIALAQLQAADQNNIAEPTSNMEDALSRLAHKVLQQIGEHWTTVKDISYLDKGRVKIMKVVGENAPKPAQQEAKGNIIRDFDKINCHIIPGSAFSDLQRRQDALDLFKSGILDGDAGKEVVLEAYKWGGIRELIDRMAQESSPKSDPEVQKAEAENMAMAQGQVVQPQPNENHEMHMLVHSNYLKSQEVRSNPQLMQALVAHIRAHESMMNPAAAATILKPPSNAQPTNQGLA